MEETIFAASQGVTALVAMAILQGAKQAGLPSKYTIFASLAIGIIAGILSAWALDELSLAAGVVGGIIAGFTASGVYSGQKALRK